MIAEKLDGSVSDLRAPRAVPVVAVEGHRDSKTALPGEVVFTEKWEQPWGDRVSIPWHRAGDSCSTVEEAASSAWAHAEGLITARLVLKAAKESARHQIQTLRSEAERLESTWKPDRVS